MVAPFAPHAVLEDFSVREALKLAMLVLSSVLKFSTGFWLLRGLQQFKLVGFWL